jgi:hypothetical protein
MGICGTGRRAFPGTARCQLAADRHGKNFSNHWKIRPDFSNHWSCQTKNYGF